MCLGELAEVVALTGSGTAVVRRGARESTVSLLALDERPDPGDWLLVHSGFALARLTPDEARDAAEIRGAAAVTIPTQEGTP